MFASPVESVRVEFQIIDEFVSESFTPQLPNKKKDEDAGYDVFSAEQGVIPANGCYNFHTGIKMAVPLGWYYEIKGRSGLGFKGIQPFIGTLDATYNGELRVLLFNFSKEDYQVNKGDRIAQVLFHKQFAMNAVEVANFSPQYDKRGEAGFGSSGK